MSNAELNVSGSLIFQVCRQINIFSSLFLVIKGTLISLTVNMWKGRMIHCDFSHSNVYHFSSIFFSQAEIKTNMLWVELPRQLLKCRIGSEHSRMFLSKEIVADHNWLQLYFSFQLQS